MSRFEEHLSAYLDGELSPDLTRDIETALETDPDLQAALEALMAADTLAQEGFDALLKSPVPLSLATAIQNAPRQHSAPQDTILSNAALPPSSIGSRTEPANMPSPPASRGWLVAACTVLALGLGGAGGFFAGQTFPPAPQVATATPGWLVDIADYHRVYSGQVRHLVEVPASEAAHIETWLSKTVGAPVRIPDLGGHGLTFQGGRLLVAAGKPVAQLMFTDTNNRVVALCLIQNMSPQNGFANRTIGDFDMVTWGAGNANFVIVADHGYNNLDAIARSAETQV